MSNRVVNVLAAASVAGLMFALFGMSADNAGAVVGGAMGEVVENSTSKLTAGPIADDRADIAAYLEIRPAKQ